MAEPTVPVEKNERVVDERKIVPGQVLVSSAEGRWVEHQGRLYRVEPDHVELEPELAPADLSPVSRSPAAAGGSESGADQVG
jgi:hypothetical protein